MAQPMNNQFYFQRWMPACCLLLAALAACQPASTKNWVQEFPNAGTYSSVRLADLNRDGVLDIILGAGGQEEKACDTAVLAVDGKTGNSLWALPGINQFVGTAQLLDITADGIPDVFIGGRWAQFYAINGASGELIWSFYPERKRKEGSDGGWYNFTTPQWVPDQDADGLADLVVANGGDARAAAGDTIRPAGRLLLLSSRTGAILASAEMPDGRETYMSVVVDSSSDPQIYFGTGGETIGGHLYRCRIADLIQNNLGAAELLASSVSKGFVASPVLADLNHDAVRDIVVNTAEGRMLAINGSTRELLWQRYWPGTEAYTMPAPGYFTGDSTLDFFGNFAIGVFPQLNRSIRFMVDGSNGSLLFSDTIPAFQYASAIVADIDQDGYDEVILNQSALKRTQFELRFYSYLLAFDFRRNRQIALGDTLPATNLASTPWIGDLEGNGKYDLVFTAVHYQNALFDLQKPLGLWIKRFSTQIPAGVPRWAGFMGNHCQGRLP